MLSINLRANWAQMDTKWNESDIFTQKIKRYVDTSSITTEPSAKIHSAITLMFRIVYCYKKNISVLLKETENNMTAWYLFYLTRSQFVKCNAKNHLFLIILFFVFLSLLWHSIRIWDILSCLIIIHLYRIISFNSIDLTTLLSSIIATSIFHFENSN